MLNLWQFLKIFLGCSEELGDCIIRLGILAIGVGRFQDEIDTEVS